MTPIFGSLHQKRSLFFEPTKSPLSNEILLESSLLSLSGRHRVRHFDHSSALPQVSGAINLTRYGINGLKIDEIFTYFSMYHDEGSILGMFHLDFVYHGCPNVFVCSGCINYRLILYSRPLTLWKMEISSFYRIILLQIILHVLWG